MNLGLRQSLLNKNLCAKSYINTGLIAMWDGIENAGWGKHDANATVWKNLGTMGSAADIYRDYVNWTPNAAIFEKVTNRIEVFGNDSLPVSILGSEWTIEAVFIANSAYYQNYSGVCGNHYAPSSSNRGVTCAQYENDTIEIGTWAGDSYNSSSLVQSSIFIPVETTTTITMTASQNNNIFALYKNGQFIQSNNNIGDTCNVTSTAPFLVGACFGILNEVNNWNKFFSGKIHAIRLLSRALTVEEIIHNYKIDKKRFGF